MHLADAFIQSDLQCFFKNREHLFKIEIFCDNISVTSALTDFNDFFQKLTVLCMWLFIVIVDFVFLFFSFLVFIIICHFYFTFM